MIQIISNSSDIFTLIANPKVNPKDKRKNSFFDWKYLYKYKIDAIVRQDRMDSCIPSVGELVKYPVENKINTRINTLIRNGPLIIDNTNNKKIQKITKFVMFSATDESITEKDIVDQRWLPVGIVP